MLRNVAILVSAVMLAVGLGPAFAEDEDEWLRLTGLLRGNANPVPTPDPCILVNTEAATGVALDIGPFTWKSEEVADFSSNPDCLTADTAEIEGEFVITAANSDRISGVYQTVAQFDFAANEITALGHYEITGGSGDFEDARGKGVITAFGSLLPPFEVTGQLISQNLSDDDSGFGY